MKKNIWREWTWIKSSNWIKEDFHHFVTATAATLRILQAEIIDSIKKKSVEKIGFFLSVFSIATEPKYRFSLKVIWFLQHLSLGSLRSGPWDKDLSIHCLLGRWRKHHCGSREVKQGREDSQQMVYYQTSYQWGPWGIPEANVEHTPIGILAQGWK